MPERPGWDLVAGISAVEALCVLAVAQSEPGTPRGADGPLVTVDQVAGLTGMSVDRATGGLQRAAKKGRLESTVYLAVAGSGRAHARVGYRLKASKGGE